MKTKIKQDFTDYMAILMYNTAVCLMLMYIWWAVLYIIRIPFGEETIAEFILKTFIGLIGTIIFWVVLGYPLGFAIEKIEKKYFPFVETESGIYRKNVTGYYIFREFVPCLELGLSLLFISRGFHTLYKTSIAVAIIFFLYFFVELIKSLVLPKKLERWRRNGRWKDKKICTYISSKDVGCDWKFVSIEDLFKGEQDITVVEETYGYLLETPEMLICPHWLYKAYLEEANDQRRCRLLVLYDGVFERNYESVASVIDECIDAGIMVLEYVKEEEKGIADDIFDGRVVFTVRGNEGQKEKVSQFIKNEDVHKEIAYFDVKEFSYSCGKSADVLLKYRYVDTGIKKAMQMEDNTECFYQLLKLVEYVWHYRALAEIELKEKEELLRKSFKSSMGLWCVYQNKNKHSYRDRQIVEAYCLVKRLLNGKSCGGTTVNYAQICEVLTQLRNRYIGHGTMAFSVSDELLSALKQLVGVILQVFYGEDTSILERETIFADDVKAVWYRKTEEGMALCLLAGYYKGEIEMAEYLDYMNASFQANSHVIYQLEYKEEEA